MKEGHFVLEREGHDSTDLDLLLTGGEDPDTIQCGFRSGGELE